MKETGKHLVEQLLTEDSLTRDDNRRLCVRIWELEMETLNIPEHTSAEFFFSMYVRGQLSSAEHITRVSRLLQETNPNLAGERRKKLYLQEKTKEEIKQYKAERERP